MNIMVFRISIRSYQPPRQVDLDLEIDWVCSCLGLVSGRDVSRTAEEIFRRILEANRHEKSVTSEKLAEDLELSRGAVNHHLRSFIESGLIVRRKRRIFLRSSTLSGTLEEMRRDADRIFEDLIRTAKNLDTQ